VRRMEAGEDIFAELDEEDISDEEREGDFSDAAGLEEYEDYFSGAAFDEESRIESHKKKNRVSLSPSSPSNNGESWFDVKREADYDNVAVGSGEEKPQVDVEEASPSTRRSTKKLRKSAAEEQENCVDYEEVGSGKKKRRVVSKDPAPSRTKKQRKASRDPPARKTITILGATGGTGLCLVKQALEAGHRVKALVRNPDKFPFRLSSNKNLTVSEGDVTKYDDVKAALAGSTDVLVSLGGRGKDGKICSTAQPVIDKALNDTDPSMRMVVVTSMAVGDSYHDVTWMTRRFADLLLASTIKDKNLQERSVIRDTTNWVIVRPVGLSDGPLTGTATGGSHAAPPASKTIPRADVAHFILNQCLSGQDEWKRNPVTVFPPQ